MIDRLLEAARYTVSLLAAPARVAALEERVAELELEYRPRAGADRRAPRPGLNLLDVFARTR